MRKLFSSLVVISMFLACSNSDTEQDSVPKEQEAEKQVLTKDVMEVHDEAMPWMDRINSLKKELQARLDSSSNDSTNEQYRLAIAKLDSADEAMMDWMRNYREPKDTVSYNSARDYLIAERNKIAEVRNYMKNAIDNASALLE